MDWIGIELKYCDPILPMVQKSLNQSQINTKQLNSGGSF